MGILGTVTVAATTIVKVAAIVGMAVGALALGSDALALMLPEGAFGVSMVDPTYKELVRHAIPFVAGLAGFEFAHWTEGKMKVMEAKADHDAELKRLQSQHGMAF